MSKARGISPMNMSGNLATNWKFWKQKFQNFIVASELNKKSEKIQCAQLLHLIGDDGLRIYNTFTFDPSEKDRIEPLLNRFENYFLPKRNIEYERFKFFTRKQLDGESLDYYVTDLKNKALNCEFLQLKDDLIKSIFICGLLSENLREQLLELDGKCLEETIKIAQTIENANEQPKQKAEVKEVQPVVYIIPKSSPHSKKSKKTQLTSCCAS